MPHSLRRAGQQVPHKAGPRASPSPGESPLQGARTRGPSQQPLFLLHLVLHLELGHALAAGCGVQTALSVSSCVGAQPCVTGADPRSWGDTAGLEKLTVMPLGPLWEGLPPHPHPPTPLPSMCQSLERVRKWVLPDFGSSSWSGRGKMPVDGGLAGWASGPREEVQRGPGRGRQEQRCPRLPSGICLQRKSP